MTVNKHKRILRAKRSNEYAKYAREQGSANTVRVTVSGKQRILMRYNGVQASHIWKTCRVYPGGWDTRNPIEKRTDKAGNVSEYQDVYFFPGTKVTTISGKQKTHRIGK